MHRWIWVLFSKWCNCCLGSVALVEESMLMLLWAVVVWSVLFSHHWRVCRVIVARCGIVVGIRNVIWTPIVMRVLALVMSLLINLHFFIVLCSHDWTAEAITFLAENLISLSSWKLLLWGAIEWVVLMFRRMHSMFVLFWFSKVFLFNWLALRYDRRLHYIELLFQSLLSWRAADEQNLLSSLIRNLE